MSERLQKEVLTGQAFGSLFGLFEGIAAGRVMVELPGKTRYLVHQKYLHLSDSQNGSLFRFDGEKWVRTLNRPLTTREHPKITPAQVGGAQRIITLSCQEALGSPRAVVVVAGSAEYPEIYGYRPPSRCSEGGFAPVKMGEIADFLNHEKFFLLIRYWQKLVVDHDFYSKMAEFVSWVSAAELIRVLK